MKKLKLIIAVSRLIKDDGKLTRRDFVKSLFLLASL